jgi:hypothetical protein
MQTPKRSRSMKKLCQLFKRIYLSPLWLCLGGGGDSGGDGDPLTSAQRQNLFLDYGKNVNANMFLPDSANTPTPWVPADKLTELTNPQQMAQNAQVAKESEENQRMAQAPPAFPVPIQAQQPSGMGMPSFLSKMWGGVRKIT